MTFDNRYSPGGIAMLNPRLLSSILPGFLNRRAHLRSKRGERSECSSNSSRAMSVRKDRAARGREVVEQALWEIDFARVATG